MDREHLLSQVMAMFCIVFGALVCGAGCKYGVQWEALKTLGASISGAGMLAVTQQIKQTLNNNAGGKVSLTESPSDPSSEKTV